MEDSSLLAPNFRKRAGWAITTLVLVASVATVTLFLTFSPDNVELAQAITHKNKMQSRMQSLYEDVPYDVDPVISSASYIPRFAKPEDRNTIYQGVDEQTDLPSIYEDGPHVDEITDSSFSEPDGRNPVYQGIYTGYEAANAAKANGAQMLYEDVPYDVDPVISSGSYIPRFAKPEERNPTYQGEYAGYEAA
jgi:hypothetical protein